MGYERREYAMGHANTLWDTRIRYGPREYAMRYANTLWDTRIRYEIREYAMGHANTLWETRIRYGPREYAMSHANTLCDLLGHHNVAIQVCWPTGLHSCHLFAASPTTCHATERDWVQSYWGYKVGLQLGLSCQTKIHVIMIIRERGGVLYLGMALEFWDFSYSLT